MNVTAKCYTSVRYTQDQLKSMRQRIQLVSTNPVHFFYQGEKLEIDHIGVHITPQRYGFDLVFSDVLDFPDIPEGHEVTIQMISTNGDTDCERYIGNFNLVVAELTPEIRFHEFLTTGRFPDPQYTDLGSVTEDVESIAKMEGAANWNFGTEGDDYVVRYNGCVRVSGDDLELLHVALLTTSALNTKEKLCQSSL